MTEKTITIPIKGKKVVGKTQKIKIDLIEYDEFNPRISMSRDSEIIGSGAQGLSQKTIEFFLKAQPAYIELKNAIRNSGGATIPIWIYPIGSRKYKVIEGNTRLAIHKELEKDEDEEDAKTKYGEINCIVLPEKLDEELKDYIRLVCHLRGHTDWDVYERAKYLNNLYNEEKYPAEELAKITKLSATDILQDIEAYKIMDVQFKKKYGEFEIVHKFSYFREFVKNKKLRYTMEFLNLTTDDFCDWIGNKKLNRAMDVRKLNDILTEPSSRETFIKKDLDRAINVLRTVIPEKSERVYMLMADLNKKIDKIEFVDIEDISSKKSKKRKVIFELYSKLKKLLAIK